ncbi:hypothetical protein GCM10020254_44210 [Streptomyces goshikiensis]
MSPVRVWERRTAEIAAIPEAKTTVCAPSAPGASSSPMARSSRVQVGLVSRPYVYGPSTSPGRWKCAAKTGAGQGRFVLDGLGQSGAHGAGAVADPVGAGLVWGAVGHGEVLLHGVADFTA